jgi:4-hydroxy-3-polyprenylbenzoate decarboxylase
MTMTMIMIITTIMSKKAKILIAVTGASGAIYARRLQEELSSAGEEVELILSHSGRQVVQYEKQSALLNAGCVEHDVDNFFAPPASGSAPYRAMVIVPASMGTIGRIAAGTGDNLLVRAADVFLKEKRSCIIVPREMPMHQMHLENMARLAGLGATILPASPHFYNHPQSIDDVVNTVVARILDHLQVSHELEQPWGTK